MSLEMVSAVTALVAVVVSPLVSLYTVRKEVNAQVRSANRQTWINGLRALLARYLTEISVDESLHRDVNDALLIAHKRVRRIHRLLNELVLYLNSSESEHQSLVDLLRAAAKDVAARARGENIDPMRNRKEIIAISQSILKREWERVKKGE